ncbi:late competence protein ComER [Paenibacillus sp. MBLB4367]|uniref:late competence protein ComER n=1 Tax=Paenibacillus sp. MBLB4367 TaxID=3384767 RepID=UPI0039084348
MKIGFIGTGSMGSILIESLIRSGALLPQHIVASNRTANKAEQLAYRYPGLQAASSNVEVAEQCGIMFICVKPSEFKKVIDDIKPRTSASQIVISITSPVLIRHLEEQLPCKIAKVIPSITNYVECGPTICMYGERLTNDDIEHIETMLARFSRPIRVSEKYTRVTSDISSCGPAFFANLLQSFIAAAVKETGIPYEQAAFLACEMLLGTGKLLTAGGFTPESLQQRVAVPGGITAEGLKLMNDELRDVFNQLFRITQAKYEEDVDKASSMLS